MGFLNDFRGYVRQEELSYGVDEKSKQVLQSVSLNFLKDSGLQGLAIGLKELKNLQTLHLELQ